jgi:putative phosphoribosyl transferase
MLITPLFQDRVQAGQVLARKLRRFVFDADTLVLALPRGGVPVAFQVAHALPAELDICLVRKIGVPGEDELAMGAIASGGTRVLNKSLIRNLGISPAEVEQATAKEQREIERREHLYRDGRPALSIKGRTAILVDDGLATGASMLAAVQAVRTKQPRRVVVAVPVASRETCDDFRRLVDDVICAATPEPFHSVGVWYQDFSQTSDAEVCELLERASHQHVASGNL